MIVRCLFYACTCLFPNDHGLCVKECCDSDAVLMLLVVDVFFCWPPPSLSRLPPPKSMPKGLGFMPLELEAILPCCAAVYASVANELRCLFLLTLFCSMICLCAALLVRCLACVLLFPCLCVLRLFYCSCSCCAVLSAWLWSFYGRPAWVFRGFFVGILGVCLWISVVE
jgi:hypothetical protein